jgi:hypothetical protein
MNTRWSIVLAALCLTLMALVSGRAAHAASVTGAGTVASDLFGELWFSVHARSGAGEPFGSGPVRTRSCMLLRS